jgi:iron complex transport system substrate-binding protein
MIGFFSMLLAMSSMLRLVSLSPAPTEDLFFIGAGPSVVGIDRYVVRPEAATHVQKVGSLGDANVEQIVGLRPSSVIYQDTNTALPLIGSLKRAGLNVVRVPGQSLNDDWSTIQTMGVISHREAVANALVDRLKKHIDRLSAHVAKEKRLRVLVVLWANPIWSVAQGSFADELLTKANLVNVVHSAPKAWPMLTPEIVATLNPDVIIVADSASLPTNVAPWTLMSAVQHKHIAVLHERLDCGPYIDRLFDDLVKAVGPYRQPTTPLRRDMNHR